MIDSHTHLSDELFDEDLEAAVARAMEAGIDRFILPATSDDTHDKIFSLAARYPNVMYPTIGLHPTDINGNEEYRKHLERVAEIASNPPLPIVAIGEIGIDLHWDKDFLSEQQEGFKYQIELAIKHNLPIIIHSRDAWDETFEVLEPYKGRVRGVFHSFSGTEREVERIEALGGFYYGINGTVTYKKSVIPEALLSIPLDKILLETDSPYLPPVPYRGKRNESSYIPFIANKIAEVKGITTSKLADFTTRNTELLFGLLEK